MEDNQVQDRRFSRGKKPREVLIGRDSTGAEYWLVPFSEAKIGNRQFEIRNSKKQVPAMLQGMVTDAATADRMFKKWQQHELAKKKTPSK